MYGERTVIPFKDSSSDEEDVSDDDGSSLFLRQFESSNRRRPMSQFKSTTRKRKKVEVQSLDKSGDDHMKDSSDEDEVQEVYRNESSGNGESSSIALHANQEVDDLLEEKIKTASENVDAASTHNKNNKSATTIDMSQMEENLKMYRDLLAKLQKSSSGGSGISTSAEVEIKPVDVARSQASASSHASLKDLPQVRNQFQRKQIASTVAEPDGPVTAIGKELGEQITFTTKLNDKDVWPWKIGSKETFAKMKAKFRSIYGLGNAVKVTMTDPNGEQVKDNNTPEGIEMEPNDQFDVRIPPNLLANAISTAKATKSAPSSGSNGSTNISSTQNNIRFTTLLNGKHKRKWQIVSTDTFQKFKAKFRSIYGLGSSVKMTMTDPNGEQVEDNNTPEGIEMEQGDLIDVQIAPNLFNKAIAAAEKALAAQKSQLGSPNNGVVASNYVSSVSALLAEQQASSQDSTHSEKEPEKEPESITCKIVVPGSFCQSGDDTIIPVIVKPATPLRVVHDHLIHTSSVLLAGNGSTGTGYWFSLESSLEDVIGLDTSLGALRFLSRDSYGLDDLTLIMHKKTVSPCNPCKIFDQSSPVLEVQLLNSTNPRSKAAIELPSIKVKPGQKCQKLMALVADNFLQIPLHKLVFRIVRSAFVLKPELTFQTSGVQNGDIIRVESL